MFKTNLNLKSHLQNMIKLMETFLKLNANHGNIKCPITPHNMTILHHNANMKIITFNLIFQEQFKLK